MPTLGRARDPDIVVENGEEHGVEDSRAFEDEAAEDAETVDVNDELSA